MIMDDMIHGPIARAPRRRIHNDTPIVPRAVADKIEKCEPVLPPGVPRNYPDPKKLVTEEWIRPRSAP